MKRFIALVLAAALALPSLALAQAGQPSQPQPAESVDATKLGVDLARIKRELVEPETESEGDSPLRLRFSVQVIGVAPRINLLEGFALDGPMQYGSPTHQEVLTVLTPQAYRSPTVDFLGLAVLAAQKLGQLGRKQRCEAEVAEYRQLVMQGVAVAAPRCTQ